MVDACIIMSGRLGAAAELAELFCDDFRVSKEETLFGFEALSFGSSKIIAA